MIAELEAVENALVLAATRRMIRPGGVAPLGTVRSLAYFMPVIEEVLQMQVSTEYFHYLRHKLQRAALASRIHLSVLPGMNPPPCNAPSARMKPPSLKTDPPPHAYGVDDDAGPAPKSCSRRWQFQRDATWQILASSEGRVGAID